MHGIHALQREWGIGNVLAAASVCQGIQLKHETLDSLLWLACSVV
ncbi:hypothetical protein CAter282_2891 [Collimonas arenae]|uniref:Uncharacterized protein n=1 Tax=Collimonas arenae TaxID=279058 RepID=A0A127QKU7_9BURK|nr:hypothetical protein CAter10_3184 [Collimonas arenae]AMP10616.1 hypothetical protein CAter282_2891 [Collimonas arenae]